MNRGINLNAVDPHGLPCVIASNLNGLPESAGIYFVLKNKNILYIGESVNIRERWKSHEKRKDIAEEKDVKISYLALDAGKRGLTEAESFFLIKFQPQLNKKVPFKPVEPTPKNDNDDPKSKVKISLYLSKDLVKRMKELGEIRHRNFSNLCISVLSEEILLAKSCGELSDDQ